ncbi:sugar phosphate isomerase/epimerase [Curvibacter sp. HBC28]|jgi:sugar phosphate isomerase/epimerase|uniref:Sugar phosphate isomerase/epimerase n=1 Tax=Curvibacter microcysteis TaxID=3026419 RepID=A0ABT5M8V1_9BURK|nr:sugar phosphate isomerase/epimerase family protein [Curvibacter sp. HBC28]MDD0813013.1 sugar phosphate isomerase/epimerase [Curvibacter sp. HBC28]
MNLLDRYGMDTSSLAGPLEARLAAMKAAGFSQVMLHAHDLVGHPGGVAEAVQAVQASGLRPTGLQVLRDYEGLSGVLHDYKVDIAKSLLQTCAQAGSQLLVLSSSTSPHASADWDTLAADLRKLAMLAVPLGIRVAYEALSWGRTVNDFVTAWDLVCDADCPNLGLCLDTFHILAAKTPLDALAEIDPERIFLVQLSDFMWHEIPTVEDRMTTARSLRVFPGEGAHSEPLADLALRLDRLGYTGDYSFEVFNEDYQQLPLDTVAARARRAAGWLHDDVLRKAAPLPLWATQRP